MNKLDPQERPSVDEISLSFLQEMKNSGIFKTHYDAWAFGVALALKNDLPPQGLGKGKEQMAPLSVLEGETRFALEQATLARLKGKSVENLLDHVSSLAIAGLREMNSHMKDLSISERVKWVLSP